DARTVDIYFRDGLSMRGDVVATDPYRDLALLKIDMNTKPVSLGDSDSIRIGEIVLAIGSPFGLMGPTVTMGVVSAVGRTIIGENIILEDLIQTDAAINPGNSGGPLINTEGKAIAVATAIIPYAQGIGFAIPINSVKRFIDMLNKYGRPVIARIGVYVASINRNLARMYGLSIDRGVIVIRVEPGSPAYDSGIREGDIIVKANDREIVKPSDLRRVIEESIDNKYVVLEIVRDRRRYVVEVPLIIETPY
ncbi:MAG: trypsin-like peptidase domain-containing protein, partial [Desulfurococcaceae archaeon]